MAPCRWPVGLALVLLVVSASAGAQTADDFFDDSILHDVRLSINSRDWEALKEHYEENTYYPCDMRWGPLVVRNIGIRSRGTGSRSGTKPGLRVDVNRYAIDQRFLDLKSFVLRNNTQDPSHLRERISMRFLRRLDLPAPREAHTRLFINNSYVGLYTIVEAVDKAFLQRVFNQDDGYLYEYDYDTDDQPYYFEYRGSDPAAYVPKPFQPQTHELDPRPEMIERLVWTINETGEAVFRSAIAEFLDLKRFIQHVAIENFLAEQDGFLGDWGMNNFYLYRFEDTSLFTLLPWDKSNTFIEGPEYPIWRNVFDVPDEIKNRLMSRAIAYTDLRDLYLDTLLDCARSAGEIDREVADGEDSPPNWLETEIERGRQQIAAAVRTDQFRPFTVQEFEDAVNDMKAFARRRPEFVRQEVEQARRETALTPSASAGRE